MARVGNRAAVQPAAGHDVERGHHGGQNRRIPVVNAGDQRAQTAAGTVLGMRCGVCGSERLSPVGELISADRWKERLQFRFSRPGLLKARPTFDAGFARACRDCGALFAFLSGDSRARLDAVADDLTDVDGYTTGPANDRS